MIVLEGLVVLHDFTVGIGGRWVVGWGRSSDFVCSVQDQSVRQCNPALDLMMMVMMMMMMMMMMFCVAGAGPGGPQAVGPAVQPRARPLRYLVLQRCVGVFGRGCWQRLVADA
jgi:hypothetical protein